MLFLLCWKPQPWHPEWLQAPRWLWVHPDVGGEDVTFRLGKEGDLGTKGERFVKTGLQCSVEEQCEHGL